MALSAIKTPLKRSRIDKETQSDLRMSSASDGWSITSSTAVVDTAKTTSFVARTTTKDTTRGISHRSLVDMLFPKVHFKYESYGNALSSFTRQTAPLINDRMDNLSTTNGRSQWWEFHHLPDNDNMSAVDYNLSALIAKTQDAQSFQTPYSIFQVQGDSTKRFATPIAYLGGSYVHTFYNTSNFNCTLKFYLCKPRRYIRDQLHISSVNPVKCSLADKIQNTPYADSIDPDNNLALVDSATDPLFDFHKSDRSLHYNWIVSTPRTVTLAPGETVKYTVICPPFTFDDSRYKTSMATTSAGGHTPTYLPFSTQVLCVRLFGSLGHNADNNPIINGPFTQVGFSSAHLLHHFKSYHCLRSMPPAVADQHVYFYGINPMTGTGGINIDVENVDPDGNEMRTYDDDETKET